MCLLTIFLERIEISFLTPTAPSSLFRLPDSSLTHSFTSPRSQPFDFSSVPCSASRLQLALFPLVLFPSFLQSFLDLEISKPTISPIQSTRERFPSFHSMFRIVPPHPFILFLFFLYFFSCFIFKVTARHFPSHAIIIFSLSSLSLSFFLFLFFFFKLKS